MNIIRYVMTICVLLNPAITTYVNEKNNHAVAVSSPLALTGNPEQLYRMLETYHDGIDAKSVRERLNALALFLKLNSDFRGYIISYAGRRTCHGEALQRAKLAKRFLTRQKKIEPRRVTIIDGGYRKEWVVQLWYAPSNAVDRPPITETIDKQEIQFIKKCNFQARF